jgi:hypothetical protein
MWEPQHLNHISWSASVIYSVDQYGCVDFYVLETREAKIAKKMLCVK